MSFWTSGATYISFHCYWRFSITQYKNPYLRKHGMYKTFDRRLWWQYNPNEACLRNDCPLSARTTRSGIERVDVTSSFKTWLLAISHAIMKTRHDGNAIVVCWKTASPFPQGIGSLSLFVSPSPQKKLHLKEEAWPSSSIDDSLSSLNKIHKIYLSLRWIDMCSVRAKLYNDTCKCLRMHPSSKLVQLKKEKPTSQTGWNLTWHPGHQLYEGNIWMRILTS